MRSVSGMPPVPWPIPGRLCPCELGSGPERRSKGMAARCARTPGELAYLTGNTARLSFFTCACARVAGWALLRATAARRCAVHCSVWHNA